MLAYAINRINNYNNLVINKKTVSSGNNRAIVKNTKENGTERTRVININSRAVKYIYENQLQLKCGKSLAPHNRRGHFKHYKNGKVIWIKQISINKGADNNCIKHVYRVSKRLNPACIYKSNNILN